VSRFGAVEKILPLCIRPRLHRFDASRAKRTIAKNSNETEMLLVARCRRFNDRDSLSLLLTEPGRGPWQRGQCARRSSRAAKSEMSGHRRAARRRAEQKNPYGLKALGAWGTAKRILN
jgi:hypothetical protein